MGDVIYSYSNQNVLITSLICNKIFSFHLRSAAPDFLQLKLNNEYVYIQYHIEMYINIKRIEFLYPYVAHCALEFSENFLFF